MTDALLNGLASFLLLVGSAFCLLAALGVLLMSDVFTRMQAASKAVTLGASSVILAAVIHMPELDVAARGLLVCVFLVVTIPAATHLLARAAYHNREPLARETEVDEMHHLFNHRPDVKDIETKPVLPNERSDN